MLTSYTHLGTSSHIKQKKERTNEHRQYIEFAGERTRKRKKERQLKSEQSTVEPLTEGAWISIYPFLGASFGQREREKEKKHLLVIRLEVCVLIHHRWNKPVPASIASKLVRLNKSNALSCTLLLHDLTLERQKRERTKEKALVFGLLVLKKNESRGHSHNQLGQRRLKYSSCSWQKYYFKYFGE